MLRFHELSPSPNNIKVRLALQFKGIEFEVEPVDRADRSRLIAISGQELSPVIEDRGIVLHDSEAILHYLDANYPETRRLYPATREGRKECDAFNEILLRRMARPWLPVFFRALGIRASMDEGAPERVRESLKWLESELGDRASFGGETAPVMDLRAALWSMYAFPTASLLQRVPILERVRDLIGADPSETKRLVVALEPWYQRLG